jgi:hypothetical protein
LPEAVSTSTIQLFDQTIKVHHLNDGRRVIDSADLEKFWKYLAAQSSKPLPEDLRLLKKAMEGLK